jgi:DnaA-homolog protein
MQQLPLEISRPPEPTLDNFIQGANAEAHARVRALAEGVLGESVVYLWGAAGTGRSHLLRAAARAGGARLVCADDVDGLNAAGQQALFNAINTAREGGAAVLAAGGAPPAQLALRPDLASRLGWGLVYQLHPLTDAHKAAWLRGEAAQRGLQLGDDVVDYLLTRLPRDLPSLAALLAQLDRYALARKRQITLPLVREFLQSQSR